MKFDEYYISDLVEVTSSKRVYAKDYSSYGIPFYRSKEIILLSKGYNIKDSLYITKEKYENIEKNSIPKEGDILLTSVGTIGVPLLILKSHLPFYFKDGNLIRFHNFKSLLINKYLFYWLKSPIGKHEINKITIGSTQKALTMVQIKKIPIKIPSISCQNKIVSILSSLDSKIEVNNQIISNLEELASTLFKRWFVDFEFPDENGNPYKSSGGKMVDSELGEIPEGWEVTNLEEISIDIITGKTPNTKQKENYGEDIPFIKIPDMHNNTYIVQTETYLSKKGSDSQYKKLLPKDSICVSCIATPGLVSITSVASHTNQQINTILPKVEDLYFLYLDLKRKRNLIRELGSGGSTTLNLNKTQFGKINIINCGKREKMNFNKICEPLFSKILLLQKSNIYLAKLRDSLLPKLLSGEIELPEDEEV